MDPNLDRRDSCKVCRGRLPERKTKFCSSYCERRYRRWKNRDSKASAEFLGRVADPVWIDRDKQPAVSVPAGVHRVGGELVLVRSGRIVGRGVPCAPGELSYAAVARRERRSVLAAARWHENRKKRDDEKQARRQRRRGGRVELEETQAA